MQEGIKQKNIEKPGNNTEYVLKQSIESGKKGEDLLNLVQFSFVDNLYKKKYKNLPYETNPEETFSDLFFKYVRLGQSIGLLRKLNPDINLDINENFVMARKKYKTNIENIYNDSGIKGLKDFFDKIDLKEKTPPNNENEHSGILYHSKVPDKNYKPYENEIYIHFSKDYSRKKKVSFEDMTNSMTTLAEKIVNNGVYVPKITAVSWLMDIDGLRNRLGFIENEQEDFDPKNASLGIYGQFLDSDGKLKKKEVKEFLETGIPPHKLVHASIDIKDFIFKYLPEKRGEEIKFSALSEEGKEIWLNSSRRNVKLIEKKFEDGDLKGILNEFMKDKVWKEVLSDEVIYNKLIKALEFLKLKKKNIKEIDILFPELGKDIDGKKNLVMSKLLKKYREKITIKIPENKE